ncbi:hypothetical protein [Nocardia jejuensis]|uniref:hypothetical protein n=1 Tax=Nocardia jejuensis TaxID=328049 RepID=UPI000A575B94|nr:hypothetical protein [Nocardia jejuensis]
MSAHAILVVPFLAAMAFGAGVWLGVRSVTAESPRPIPRARSRTNRTASPKPAHNG